MLFFFFFKQKTAYEMRISDWSSDVCSSDLMFFWPLHQCTNYSLPCCNSSKVIEVSFSIFFPVKHRWVGGMRNKVGDIPSPGKVKIGRASCRERVCQYG